MEDLLKQIAEGQQRIEEKLDHLIKTRGGFVENGSEEFVTIDGAKTLLNRGRTWISTRMIKPDEVTASMNASWFLVKGLDWHREGRIIMFRVSALKRLKAEMQRMGELYEKKIGIG